MRSRAHGRSPPRHLLVVRARQDRSALREVPAPASPRVLGPRATKGRRRSSL